MHPIAVTTQATFSVVDCHATANGSPLHTRCRQSAGSTFPFPASPMLCRFASRVIGGVSLPEVLHCAHRSLCFSPPIEHSPTSPNHELTPSTLEVISLTIFGKPKISNSGSQSAPPKPKLRFGSASHIGALTAHSAFAKSRFRDLRCRVSGGLCRRQRGAAPNPRKGCVTAF